MSDYIPTVTVQYHDYAAARKERKREREKAEKEGDLFFSGRPIVAALVTEVRPNPLSMELRIVFGYLWNMYTDCLEAARLARESRTGSFGGSTAESYERDAREAVSYAYLLCHELFDVTSPHAPFHIHSEHGCNDETCPAWVRGRQAAMDNVHDWYQPDC